MTHPHSHMHGQPQQPAPRRAVQLTLAALIPAAIATLIGLMVLWPTGSSPDESGQRTEYADGTVLAVSEQVCPDTGTPAPVTAKLRCGTVTVRIGDGPDAGRQVTTTIPTGLGAPEVGAGDDVILIGDHDAGPQTAYQIIDHERGSGMWALALAFGLAVVAFGRWRGVRALAGLAITFAILLLFVVPAILGGSAPLAVAITGSAAIMLIVLYLTHGINLPTSMALLGTLSALTLTGLLALLSTSLLHLTGVASEEASFVAAQFPGVNMLGLLLAGIIIGSLGVLDDITITQAYTVAELAEANPSMGFTRLYTAASRIGRHLCHQHHRARLRRCFAADPATAIRWRRIFGPHPDQRMAGPGSGAQHHRHPWADLGCSYHDRADCLDRPPGCRPAPHHPVRA